ncbi:GSU2403 family nucleotidyltransferase fold protein [Fuscibacter oryzae]|uniref:GSU2403 family nucleotidyltransferase fold protein n=1 Tax=Fuscibacter oryzae TaxID=2803939 RepID=UPI002E29AB9A|nr:GSU2403 family nucleotidyltransferase fold protein [Fuscibacter oryzae]
MRTQSEARASDRARLVRILRAERFMGLDATTGSLLAAMAAAGVFRLGGTIVGTHAFRLYEAELGRRHDRRGATGIEGLRPLAALGVTAQALRHLNYLIADPIPAAVLYRSGVLVQIPRPERFAIHKLIVAERRSGRDRIKALKDLAQAALLIEALAQDRPDDLRDAHQDALSRGPKWRDPIAASVEKLPELAAFLP